MAFGTDSNMRNPWGSNPKAANAFRKHVMDMRMQGKKPLTPQNWWNANRTKIAQGQPQKR